MSMVDQSQSHSSTSPLLLSRRVLLRRTAWCALGWPLLARVAMVPNLAWAATAEVVETEDNMEGPFYRTYVDSFMAGPLPVSFNRHVVVDLCHSRNGSRYPN
jgi:hypothetical protein